MDPRAAYFVRRIAELPVVVVLVTFLDFALVRLAPSNPIELMVAKYGEIPQVVEALKRYYGLDRPYHEQYFIWLWQVFHGNLGVSIRFNEPVAKMILSSIPITMAIALLALVLSTVLSISAGVIAATRKGRWPDYVIRAGLVLGQATPDFFLGLLLILVFAVGLKWVPISFPTSPDIGEYAKVLILPVVALAAPMLALLTRIVRSSMLDVLVQNYILVARSKGLPDRTIILGHALRNALIPVITIVAMNAAYLLSGTVLLETMFGLPGMGRLMVQAALLRDYTLTQGILLVYAMIFVIANLAADVLYSFADPRIKYQKSVAG